MFADLSIVEDDWTMINQSELELMRTIFPGNSLKSVADIFSYAGPLQARILIRATEVDGKPMMLTRDFRNDRVNVIVKDGLIQRVDGIG